MQFYALFISMKVYIFVSDVVMMLHVPMESAT